MSKKLLYVSGSVLALCLAVGSTAFAATGAKAPFKATAPRALMATVNSVSGNTLAVTARGQNSTVTTVDVSNAKVFVDGVAGSPSGIKTGDKIIVLGTLNGTTFNATRITDGAASKTGSRGMVSGVVSSISGNTITISETQHARVAGKVATSTTLTINASTDSKTRFNVTGVKKATIANIKVGDRVSIMGVDDTGAGTAIMISDMAVKKK